SRNFASRINTFRANGYQFRLTFVWVPSADFCVSRVAARVRLGGHDVPEQTIHRRFERGLANFFNIYRPLADHWQVYDNSGVGDAILIAEGDRDGSQSIYGAKSWQSMTQVVMPAQ